MERNIADVLIARKDISPFLAHLTRDSGSDEASDVLTKILKNHSLEVGEFFGGLLRCVFGTNEIPGPARNGATTTPSGVVCLTETPLEEIHCLIDIAGRKNNLQPYGIILLKDIVKSLPDIGPQAVRF